ncbi:MAG: bifunctional (p)ppGpp synthetase/guanosine-3',5'-bis(diphosphate) 3'-pyrophosphohydrolase, partial [Treponema sp.]|nr:bifunctional (p)ppGpp synthetase/guanosine-3',5'-bis(diphosphate) 3'-pyrophosphohydrolase [Treponema sp.]
AHQTQGQLLAVKTGKARQKIHSWLTANDPTFIDKEALEKREAEIAANTIHSKQVAEEKRKKRAATKKPEVDYTGKIRIENTTNFMVTIAKCCSPKPGDPIAGYVSRNRGITIHKASCLTYLRIQDVEKRTVKVEWDTGKQKSAKQIEAENKRKEKMREQAIAKNKYSRQR